MKVKVKGLVFVGFAAAILSANAMAVNEAQTVTSKAFTEATYQKKSTAASIGNSEGTWTNLTQSVTSSSDHTTAPTAKAVYDAIDTAVQAIEDGAVYQAKSAEGQEQYVADGAGGWEALDKATSVTANDTKPVTAQAVYNALNDTTNGHSNYQSYSTTAQQVSDGAGGWQALTKDTTVTENSANPVTSGAVYSAINALDNEYQEKSTVAQQVSDGAGGWQALTKDTTVTENSANPVTSGAVYDAIQDATGGLTIPEQNPLVCTAAHPCALVNEAGTLHWYTMAQDGGYAGGELGDAQ